MKLTLEKTTNSKEVYRITKKVPRFFENFSGGLVTEKGALAILESLPPKKTQEDKFVFLVKQEEETIGLIDFVRGYPTDDTGFLGLFLLDENKQNQGLGTQSFHLLENFSKELGMKKLRLGVADENTIGRKFWEKCEFAYSELLPEYEKEGKIIPTWIMEK